MPGNMRDLDRLKAIEGDCLGGSTHSLNHPKNLNIDNYLIFPPLVYIYIYTRVNPWMLTSKVTNLTKHPEIGVSVAGPP